MDLYKKAKKGCKQGKKNDKEGGRVRRHLPGRFSATVTLKPRWAKRMAAKEPTKPPPTKRTCFGGPFCKMPASSMSLREDQADFMSIEVELEDGLERPGGNMLQLNGDGAT